MIFCMIDMKSMMTDFQLPIPNLVLQVILTYQYINKYLNGVAYTIGEKQASQLDAVKLYDMMKECISVLTYLIEFFIFLPKPFFY